MSANDEQVGGDHYRTLKIQCWDYVVANGLGFLEGNIIKYVSRHAHKHGVDDLKKARHYLNKLIEVEEAKQQEQQEQQFKRADGTWGAMNVGIRQGWFW